MLFLLLQIGQAEDTVRGRRRKTKFYTGPIWPEEPKLEPVPPTELYERAEAMLAAIHTQEQLAQQEIELKQLSTSLERLSEQKKYLRMIRKRLAEIEDELDDEYLLLH